VIEWVIRVGHGPVKALHASSAALRPCRWPDASLRLRCSAGRLRRPPAKLSPMPRR